MFILSGFSKNTSRALITFLLSMVVSSTISADVISNARPVANVQDKVSAVDAANRTDRTEEDAAKSAMLKIYQSRGSGEHDQAVATVQALIDKGSAYAAFRLGRYFHVEARNKDYARAMSLYKFAMDKGDGWAANNIGLMYENGKGVQPDVAKAIEFYRLSVERNHYHGFTNLARLYFTGAGVQKNIATGQAWLDQGMKKGVLEVYKEASAIYYYGQYDLPVDFSRALRYEEAAAKLGDQGSAWRVAKMYLDGVGTPQNTAKAIEMFNSLAANGDAAALNSLGSVYSNGKGVPVDKLKAVSYWERAANLNNCLSMRNLSVAYSNGWGVQVDEAKATDYIKDAANCGTPPDGFDVWKLGTRYRDGTGVGRDCLLAEKVFTQAVLLGYSDAITDLGYMYQNGCGAIQPDQKRSFKTYLVGAKLGVILCQNNVGAMLKHGYGVDAPDRVKAFAWLMLAAENGSEIAKKNLTDFDSMFSDADKAKGMEHLRVIKNILAQPKSYENLVNHSDVY